MQVNEYKPLIVAFCCNWCSYAGADLAGNNRLNYPADVKIIRVEWVSAAEGAKFAATMNDFAKTVAALGENKRLEDLRCKK